MEELLFDKKTDEFLPSEIVFQAIIDECTHLLYNDIIKLVSKKPNPKIYKRISYIIQRHADWLLNKEFPLDDKAYAFLFYLKERKSFEGILGKYTPKNL